MNTTNSNQQDANQQDDIKKWMEDIAKQGQPKKKLIFDKKTKKDRKSVV